MKFDGQYDGGMRGGNVVCEKGRVARPWALRMLVAGLLGLVLVLAAGCREDRVTQEPLLEEPLHVQEEAEQVPATEPADEQEDATDEAKKETEMTAEKTVVKLETTHGDIMIELFDEKAPLTAGSFLLLVEDGFYDGLTFHRVEPGFVIQGGDPEGTGAGGPDFRLPLEVESTLRHDRGVLSMARKPARDSGGSQFFICLGGPGAVGHLDGGYAVFGKVTEGMNAVDNVVPGDKIIKATVVSLSENAENARTKATEGRLPL